MKARGDAVLRRGFLGARAEHQIEPASEAHQQVRIGECELVRVGEQVTARIVCDGLGQEDLELVADRARHRLQVAEDLPRHDLLDSLARPKAGLEVEEQKLVAEDHHVLQVAVLVHEARLTAIHGELVPLVPDGQEAPPGREPRRDRNTSVGEVVDEARCVHVLVERVAILRQSLDPLVVDIEDAKSRLAPESDAVELRRSARPGHDGGLVRNQQVSRALPAVAPHRQATVVDLQHRKAALVRHLVQVVPVLQQQVLLEILEAQRGAGLGHARIRAKLDRACRRWLGPNEPVFQEAGERRVFGVVSVALASGIANVDRFRHAIERLDPVEYLSAG